MKKFKTVDFKEVETYNGGNTLVWTGLLLDGENEAELKKQMTEFFAQERFFLEGTEIVELCKIGGNIKGSKGRSDALLVLNQLEVNPFKRFSFDGLVWTEDFIVNYAKDYGVKPEEAWVDVA